jgi:3-oxoacyl-[acyl-carrier-protein] synthase-3
MTKFAKIVGTGCYLPPRVVSNDALAQELAARGLETSDAWIVERTGIRQRHIAAPDVPCSVLATEAAKNALAAAAMQASEIDLIICATSTPDFVFPSTACLIQKNLGIQGGAAFDVQAVQRFCLRAGYRRYVHQRRHGQKRAGDRCRGVFTHS